MVLFIIPSLSMRTIVLSIMLALCGESQSVQAQSSPEVISIDARAPAAPFPHFWERAFGSGRAALSLRDSYRNDLREVKHATGLEYIRFHAIFHDELGVYDEDPQGHPLYNFSYIDQVYDGLLANGVRPFVEISFMPRKLALRLDEHPFWYKQIVSPPKDYATWDDLIHHFAQHLVDRYGIDEVAQWYFEVWNEPNIDFWSGDPKLETYYELYDHTARALKSVNPRLRVGGPSTAAADWVDVFLAHVSQTNVPIDFVSSHGYADDTVEHLFHNHDDVPMDERVCKAIAKVHQQIENSVRPQLPLMWTEWNVPSFGRLQARDTAYVGTALASDIRQCDGLVDILSFWTFDDVFEETGVVPQPFYGGFGLIAAGGIKKPSFNAFALLHRLGAERLANANQNVLVTKRSDGTLAVALWNLLDPDKTGLARSFEIHVQHTGHRGTITRLDPDHGSPLPAYAAMGSPRYPTTAQIAKLNQAGHMPAPETFRLKNGTVHIDLPVNALVLLEIAPVH
jgi:xylan 1,4-beta-xylosidase